MNSVQANYLEALTSFAFEANDQTLFNLFKFSSEDLKVVASDVKNKEILIILFTTALAQLLQLPEAL